METSIPFLPVCHQDEAKLFNSLIKKYPSENFIEMAAEWNSKHADGRTIMKKLPSQLQSYMKSSFQKRINFRNSFQDCYKEHLAFRQSLRKACSVPSPISSTLTPERSPDEQSTSGASSAGPQHIEEVSVSTSAPDVEMARDILDKCSSASSNSNAIDILEDCVVSQANDTTPIVPQQSSKRFNALVLNMLLFFLDCSTDDTDHIEDVSSLQTDVEMASDILDTSNPRTSNCNATGVPEFENDCVVNHTDEHKAIIRKNSRKSAI
jgi:hypothetical protein